MASSTGEIARVYEPHELTQKLGIIVVVTVLGSISTPSTIFLFQYVNTSIGNWRWNVGNMVGIAMTGFYLFQFFLNYFTLHNVLKELTLKKDHLLDKNIEDSDMEYDSEIEQFEISEINKIDTRSFNKKYLITLKAVFQNKHVVLLPYAMGLVQVVVPIKAEEYFNWKQTDVAKLWIVSTIIGSILTIILVIILAKYVNDFFLFLGSFFSLLLCQLLMGMLPVFKDYEETAEVMLYFAMSLYLMSSSIFHILSRSILAKFVPEYVQSIMEGIRNALFEIAAFLSGLSFTLSATYLSQTMFALAVMLCASMAWYIVEEKEYRNIKVVDVKYDKITAK